MKIEKPLPGITGATKLLIPKKALGTLMALLTPYEDGMVMFAHDENSLFFRVANKTLTARKMTGQFPNYAAVLPKDQTISVVIDSNALRNSLQRVAQFAEGRVMSVKMHFEANSLVLSAHNTENGETEETLRYGVCGGTDHNRLQRQLHSRHSSVGPGERPRVWSIHKPLGVSAHG